MRAASGIAAPGISQPSLLASSAYDVRLLHSSDGGSSRQRPRKRPRQRPAHPNCPDCGAALTDRFCGHCGQPANTHRINLKHLLLHDLPHSIWHIDKGIASTFWQMLTRPGLTIRGYLAGQRTRQFQSR